LKAEASTFPLALLVVTTDGVITRLLPSTGSVRIGRAEGNDLKLDDASVSRQHAVLHLEPEPSLEDLGGSNGTALRRGALQTSGETENLVRLQNEKARLEIGDRILLGTVQLVLVRVRPPGAVSQAAQREPKMHELYSQAELAAKSAISVLIGGETGAGKDVLARYIHDVSARRPQPFLALNCAALPETLLEAELFGSEKGAFTGAAQARAGLFESAEGGTVFLDEVGELPLATQSKLLRVLEERSVMRVGGRSARKIDVKFVAATNRDLEADSESGKFRRDLYYRLSGLVLHVPPLRERPLEIEPLALGFLQQTCDSLGRPPVMLSSEARELLRAHAWPGNVRELKNAMERAALLCPGSSILPEHLPERVRGVARSGPPQSPQSLSTATKSSPPPAPSADASLDAALARTQGEIREIERARIRQALEQCAGNQSRAAEVLGISRRTLVSRLNELELPRPRK
jgi:two-component system response regulator AtoC